MAIFLLVPIEGKENIKSALIANQKNGVDFIALPHDEFFISYAGTSKELSDILGITDGSAGTGVIAAISSYYGRAPTNIWDWVKSRWEA